MTIDWTYFTPASALAGGMVINIATAILLLLADGSPVFAA